MQSIRGKRDPGGSCVLIPTVQQFGKFPSRFAAPRLVRLYVPLFHKPAETSLIGRCGLSVFVSGPPPLSPGRRRLRWRADCLIPTAHSLYVYFTWMRVLVVSCDRVMMWLILTNLSQGIKQSDRQTHVPIMRTDTFVRVSRQMFIRI